jgi:predicted acyl esterase
VWEQDVAVPLRDGIVIYADVFRPVNSERAPAILVWTPYGKQGGWFKVNVPPDRVGVPREWVSGLQCFEAPDPAWWVAKGYIIVVADVRGSMHSGGDIVWWGEAGARDVYDTVEWIAAQPWSNGRVGMAGNSQLAIMQWFAAAEQPPHLTAIAPWEGLVDQYREDICQGGMINNGFLRDQIVVHYNGLGQMEDPAQMIEQYPLMNAYWEDKRAKVERIQIPAYVVASYSSPLHARGTLAAFNAIKSKDKWLRTHNMQEWPDQYQPRNVEDLCRFFNRYLKGELNGWEETPRVRMSVLDPGGTDEVDRIEQQWPPATMRPKSLFLDAADCLLKETLGNAATTRYNSEDGQVVFKLKAKQEIEIAGFIKLKLWVEADGADDMDLFAQIYKIDAEGRKLYHIALPGEAGEGIRQMVASGRPPAMLSFAGPQGRLRASHRALDPVRSTELLPIHTHRQEERLSPGEIVAVEIAIWPVAMKIHPGETLCLGIAGQLFDAFGLPGMPGGDKILTRNRGNHIIHTGGGRDSHLLLPFL